MLGQGGKFRRSDWAEIQGQVGPVREKKRSVIESVRMVPEQAANKRRECVEHCRKDGDTLHVA